MRQYEPIWNRIKSHNHASLVTPTHNATRVIRMVSKEKDLDLGYKLLLSDRALTAKLSIKREHNEMESTTIIHFSLVTSIKESFIGVANL